MYTLEQINDELEAQDFNCYTLDEVFDRIRDSEHKTFCFACYAIGQEIDPSCSTEEKDKRENAKCLLEFMLDKEWMPLPEDIEPEIDRADYEEIIDIYFDYKEQSK